jgi:hypothetical protein
MAVKLGISVNEIAAEIIEDYRSNWKIHVLRMPPSRIPLQILRYHPKERRSVGRLFERWHETEEVH